jgi:hypothetical protein
MPNTNQQINKNFCKNLKIFYTHFDFRHRRVNPLKIPDFVHIFYAAIVYKADVGAFDWVL